MYILSNRAGIRKPGAWTRLETIPRIGGVSIITIGTQVYNMTRKSAKMSKIETPRKGLAVSN
jgi:hypothetical protein